MNIDTLLRDIQKPARYTNREYNAVKKTWSIEKLKICLAFPDLYEIGMSHLGFKIIYHMLNDREDLICERVFMPWKDMLLRLKETGESLFSLESQKPLKEFDILGFSVSYELSFTNILEMIHASKMDVLAKNRKEDDPIIFAGGSAVYNPAPLSKIIDVFFIGEAESELVEMLNHIKRLKNEHFGKKEILCKLSSKNGIYVPAVHGVERQDISKVFTKNINKDLDNSYYPKKQIVPFIKIVHDRVAVEIMRGCPNSCSFCQARSIYFPTRFKKKEKVIAQSLDSLKNTGYEQVSFLSLSTSEHPKINEIISSVTRQLCYKDINVSIPSVRIKKGADFIRHLDMHRKKTGLTFAPEAGSEKLRKILCKNINMDDIYEFLREAFKRGWRRAKLYFMVGIPGESQSDLDAIYEIAKRIQDIKRSVGGGRAQITMSINPMIPKPHTPMQWFGIDGYRDLLDKYAYLKSIVKDRHVKLDFKNIKMSFLEASISRGSCRMHDILIGAWKKGAIFDGWDAEFNSSIWEATFCEHGRDLYTLPTKNYTYTDVLPWDFVQTGVPKDWLMREHKKISALISGSAFAKKNFNADMLRRDK